MISEIFKLLKNFALEQEQREGIVISGLKLFPGDEKEWVIEDRTTNDGIVEGGETLEKCLKFLKSNVKEIVWDNLSDRTQTEKIYQLWQQYIPVHRDKYGTDIDSCYPCLIFAPDTGEILLEDCSIDWEFGGENFSDVIIGLRQAVLNKEAIAHQRRTTSL